MPSYKNSTVSESTISYDYLFMEKHGKMEKWGKRLSTHKQ